MADLSIFVDVTRGLFVQSATSPQEVVNPIFTQGQLLSVAVQFLALTGNGLLPYSNLDPTGHTASIGLGILDALGNKSLIALASSSATTAVTGGSGAAATGLGFTFNLGTTAASAYVGAQPSGQAWLECSWALSGAPSGGLNSASVLGTIRTGFLGVGLPTPV